MTPNIFREMNGPPLKRMIYFACVACVACQSSDGSTSDDTQSPKSTLPSWARYFMIVLLLCGSALFAGLTLGLMGLDKVGLEIIVGAGEMGENVKEAEYAKRIQPIREDGNLLLCTLLLGNVSVNAMLSIIMADISGGLVGFFVSSAAITILGEIIPQATCSRHALWIGYRTVPIVKVIIFMLYPLTKPMAYLLDKMLGDEIGTIHTQTALKKLVQIHVKHGAVDSEMGNIMQGAIIFKDRCASDVMTPVNSCFMLSTHDRLDFSVMNRIFKCGYSRIPVCGKDRNDIVGLLFTKDLIFVDPEDKVLVGSVIALFSRPVRKTWPNIKLDKLLLEMRRSRQHLAIVHDVNGSGPGDPFYEVKGIVTLEDIIETILQDEILDEGDAADEDVGSSELPSSASVARSDRSAHDIARFKMLSSHVSNDSSNHTTGSKAESALKVERLDLSQVPILVNQLRATYPNPFASFLRPKSQPQLQGFNVHVNVKALSRLISNCAVIEFVRIAEDLLDPAPPEDMLYQKGREENSCTIILSGQVELSVGTDNYPSSAGPFSVLASSALTSVPSYICDFSARIVSKTVRCLRIHRRDFLELLDSSNQSEGEFGGSSPHADASVSFGLGHVLESDSCAISPPSSGQKPKTSRAVVVPEVWPTMFSENESLNASMLSK